MEDSQLAGKPGTSSGGGLQLEAQENEWIKVNQVQAQEDRKRLDRKWIRITVVVVFLLIGAVIIASLPPMSQAQTATTHNPSEQGTANLNAGSKEDLSKMPQQQATVQIESNEELTINDLNDQSTQYTRTLNLLKFPKILWVQTDKELEANPMEQSIVAQNHIHFGRQGDFEVRVVNSLNAYDWLSDEMVAFVKDTHQKSKVELNVYELLRLALLYEHGGVAIRLPNILLMEGLGWVEELMREGRVLEEIYQKALSCQIPGREIIMLHEDKEDGLWYKDDFIAARPKSHLLKVLMSVIQNIVKDGVWPFLNYEITRINQDSLVPRFLNIAETLINIFHRQDSNLCSNFGLESFHVNSSGFMLTVDDALAAAAINMNEGAFERTYGKRRLLRLNTFAVANDIVAAFKAEPSDGDSLLKTRLISAEGNRWLTEPKRQTRDVQLCIVSLAAIPAEGFEQPLTEQLRRLARQTFANWNLVVFVEGLSAVSKTAGKKAVLVNASAYEGLNLQRAATKYCDPSAVVLLLDHDEALTSEKDLETLANHFAPIGVFAAFFRVIIDEQVLKPSAAMHRSVMRKVNKPNKQVLSDIGNLMRAFTVQSYRFISFVDLRQSLSGRYFDREIPLLSMLEASEYFSPCENSNIVYQIRRLERRMNISREIAFTDINITSNRLKTPNLTRHEYYAKFRYFTICDMVYTYQIYKAPVQYLAVFNDGREDEGGLLAREGLPQLIPRKIHQIWVRGEIPKFKQFLMTRLRDSHPDYEYFLWTEHNLTRENFPESYDLLQTLMEFDKKSPWSKMAMVADIARYEIVYRQGGFYLDTNYMLFKNNTLDLFLTYSLMDVQGMALRQRVFRDNGFFGAVQNHSHLGRIVSHRGLSSRNHYSPDVVTEIGPNYFGKIQLGEEELDPTIFQMSFEEFWPNYLVDGPSENVNKCETPNTTPDSEVLARSAKHSYLKNCSDYYEHYAFGLDFGKEGASYSYRRW